MDPEPSTCRSVLLKRSSSSGFESKHCFSQDVPCQKWPKHSLQLHPLHPNPHSVDRSLEAPLPYR